MVKKPFPELRQKAALKIIDNREKEAKYQERHYNVNRDIKSYQEILPHLHNFFDHVINHPTLPKQILEIGVGQGVGFYELIEKYKKRVKLTGTALRTPYSKEIAKHVRLTSAEALTGFSPESLGGIYGVYSLTYGQPELVCHRLDEVLAPNGVITTIFPQEEHFRLKMQTAEKFVELWKKMGYDVSIKDNPSKYTKETIVVAIKPGSNQATSAEKLMGAI